MRKLRPRHDALLTSLEGLDPNRSPVRAAGRQSGGPIRPPVEISRLPLISHGLPILVLLVVGGALGLALNVWVDEAYTLATTAHGPLHAWTRAIEFELQAPLYFLLLSGLRVIVPDSMVYTLRIFSLLCCILALLLWGRLVRRALPGLPDGGLLLGLAFALHPMVIFAATELRAYALVLLVTLALMETFWRGYLDPGCKPLWRVMHLAMGTLGLYTHYYLGFLLVAQAGSLLAHPGRWRLLRGYCLHMAVTALLIAPLLVAIPGQTRGYDFIRIPPDTLTTLKQIYWFCCHYLWPFEGVMLAPVRIWGMRVFILGIILFLIVFHKKIINSEIENRIIIEHFLLISVLLLSFGFLLRVFGSEMVAIRHTLLLLPPLLLLLAQVVDRALGPRSLTWLGGVLVLGGAASLVDHYAPLAKPGDFIRASRFLEAHEVRGEPILVFRPQSALALAVHYRGKNAIVPIPGPSRLDRWDPGAEALRSEAQVRGRIPDGVTAFWLVTDTGYRYQGIDYNHALLERVVSQDFRVSRQAAFMGSTVRRLSRGPGPLPDSPRKEQP